MNYTLKSLTVWNLFRFPTSPQDIKFPNSEILIVGQNEDTEGSDSNGSGKSSVLNAISWCLLGEVVKDISVSDVVRRGEKEGGATLVLANDKEIHTITRMRGEKETLLYSVETSKGITEYTRRTPSQTQEEILRNFHLDPKKYFTDYTNTIYFSSATINGFASKSVSNAERMQLLTRFVNADRFDLATLRAKEIYKSEKDSFSLVNSKIEEIHGNLPDGIADFDIYEQAVDSELIEQNTKKEEWVVYIAELNCLKDAVVSLKDARLKIGTLESILKSISIDKETLATANSEFARVKAKADEIESELNQTDSIAVADRLKHEDENLTYFVKAEASLEEKLYHTKKQIEKHLSCPACTASLYLGHDSELHQIDIEKQKALVNDYELELEKLVSARSVVVAAIKRLEKNRDEYRKLESQLETAKHDLQTIGQVQLRYAAKDLSKEDEIKAEIELLQSKIESHKDIDEGSLLSDLKKAETTLGEMNEEIGGLKEIKRSIMTWKASLKEYKKEADKHAKAYKEHYFWVEHFPLIKQAIIDSYLPIFESRINHYLKTLNTQFSVRLSLTRQKKTGGFTQEFQILVMDENGIEREYETFSEGEMRRIALCVGFSLRDIALTRNALPFDFVKIDEIVDGLDNTGIQEFFKLISTLHGQKFIVSHNEELKQLFSNIITVRRRNGVSRIEANYHVDA